MSNRTRVKREYVLFFASFLIIPYWNAIVKLYVLFVVCMYKLYVLSYTISNFGFFNK